MLKRSDRDDAERTWRGVRNGVNDFGKAAFNNGQFDCRQGHDGQAAPCKVLLKSERLMAYSDRPSP